MLRKHDDGQARVLEYRLAENYGMNQERLAFAWSTPWTAPVTSWARNVARQMCRWTGE